MHTKLDVDDESYSIDSTRDPLLQLGVRLHEIRETSVFLTTAALFVVAVGLTFIGYFDWTHPPQPPSWLITTGHTLWGPLLTLALLAVAYCVLRTKGRQKDLLNEIARKEREIASRDREIARLSKLAVRSS